MIPLPRRALLAAPALLATPAQAQAAWPTRPIRLVVASAAGGNADVVARIVAAELESRLGQRMLVENIAAASGMRATETVSRAEPDGHTLLVGTSSQLVHNIALFDPLPVDITRTLRGVAMMNEAPGVLVVRADDPARDLQGFIARARAEPGRLVIGSGPAGTTTHVMGLFFAQRAGITLEHLPYPAGAQAMRDIIGGRVTCMFDIAVTALPQIRGGAVRGLGVSSPRRLAAAPDLPTIIEGGLPDFVAGTWNSIAAPAGTPEPVVMRLNALVNEIVQAPAMKQRLEELGSFVPAAMTPTEVDAYYRREREIWIPIVRATGARAS
ncbi:MAG: tripartite tricarboxylate transporter substrate binding protein [Acetobacteraceae bacterium]|nr:tripartite tricarboxylate transporter substrate binding protein [Acetobacteraceae bacterium]MCX7686323.1 tripartite tricarboxylate transporter substrate binding protein [Acetobacteraceae bacterium]MDW8398805.1 tripartite tricarboxylate transporter substrate binding protein [Acetobacteraceae bacterium]